MSSTKVKIYTCKKCIDGEKNNVESIIYDSKNIKDKKRNLVEINKNCTCDTEIDEIITNCSKKLKINK